MLKHVRKRDGRLVTFDPTKLNNWGEWAAENTGIHWSDVVISAAARGYEGMSTAELQRSLIEVCVEKRDTGHLKMAARLLIGDIRKDVFGHIEVPRFSGIYEKLIKDKVWAQMPYSPEELNKLEGIIDNERDFILSYSTLRQFIDKYALRDITQDRIYETPQIAFMGIALYLFKEEDPLVRLDFIKDFYDALSLQKINLPTPILNGARSGDNGFASCCVITGGDTVDSIGVAEHVAYKMTARKAGIGIEMDTRSIKDPVRRGTCQHAGKLPYYKLVDMAIKANTQVSRGGSATVSFKCIDPEIDMLLRLKSQRTPEQKRLPFMDYSLLFNRLFLEAVAQGNDWMLVSRYYAPVLHELFYGSSPDAWREEYARVANDQSIPKTFIKARELATLALQMRIETGRVYLCNVEELNQHTPFYETIRISNLCQEIALPTAPYENMDELYGHQEGKGEIALCFLGALVVTRLEEDEDYEKIAYILCRALDNVMDLMDYPFASMAKSAKKRRSIGIGITDLAHHMARKHLRYSSAEGRDEIHRIAERHSYFLHKASLRLSRERGRVENSRYNQGWTPLQSYNRAIDEFHTAELRYDWEALSAELRQDGSRFSVLEAHMPCESSSLMSDSTNGVYPIRKHQIYKTSRKGNVLFIVPEYDSLKDHYQSAWSIDNKDLLKVYGIIQKFSGQAISADLYWDYYHKSDPSLREILTDWLFSAKIGVKTQYYFNSEVSTGGTVQQLYESQKPPKENV